MALTLPDPKQQAYIQKALNEDLKTRDRDLEIIKTWLLQEPHLPDTWDEQCLMTFLRSCKFSLEKCKKKLDMYFTIRALVPEFFANRDVTRPELQEIMTLTNLCTLPDLTPDGKRVNIAAIATPFDSINVSDAFKVVYMMADIRILSEKYGVTGEVFILDARITAPKAFLRQSLITYKKMLVCVQEAYPARIKEVHILNPNSFVTLVYNTLKPFLKEKLKSRIHIHKSLDSLHKWVPKEILPEEYGGSGGKIAKIKEDWTKKLEEHGTWFKEQELVASDEKRRVGKRVNCDDLFGVDGSFRKLNID